MAATKMLKFRFTAREANGSHPRGNGISSSFPVEFELEGSAVSGIP